MELVEQFLGILDKQTRIMDEMSSMKSGGNALASKNILKSTNSTFDTGEAPSPKLTSKEKSRSNEASSIFISKFFEEQKKRTKDTSQKTLTSSILKPQQKLRDKTSSDTGKTSESGGWMEKLLGMLGLGALSKPGLLKTLFKKGLSKLVDKIKTVLLSAWKGIKTLFGKLVGSIKTFSGKIWGGVKGIASKILNSKFVQGMGEAFKNAWSEIKGGFGSIKDKVIGMFSKVGKNISGLWGTITNSNAYKTFTGLIDDAVNAITDIFQGIKTLFGKLVGGIKNFLGKIWGGVKGIASKILNSKFVRGIGEAFKNAWSGIKGVFGSIKGKVIGMFSKVGERISGLWGTITNSSAYKTFTGLIDDAVNAITDIFQGIKTKIASAIRAAADQAAKLLPTPVKSLATKSAQVVSSGVKATGGLLSKAGGVFKSAGSKAVGKVVSAGKAVGGGVVRGAKNISSAAINLAKNEVKEAASGLIKRSGGMFKVMGDLTAKTAKGAARVPIIGPAIEAALATYDIAAMKKKGLSDSELQEQAGKRVISGVSGMVGAAGGAALLGALGSVVPFAGNALGLIVGGMAGDLAGRYLGGLITDYVIPKKYTKTIGAFVTGTTPPKDEMQDFIIKNGKVHKFSNKDEIMGMKTGGAINEFLREGSGNNQTMQMIVDANNVSNQYLKAIAHNTAMMVQKFSNKSSGGSPVVVSNPAPNAPPTKQMMTIPNNRAGYSSSAYAL